MHDWIDDVGTPGRGTFAWGGDMMLALFSDPDARGSRRWREVFGLVHDDLAISSRRAHFGHEPWARSRQIIARAGPKSSSDY